MSDENSNGDALGVSGPSGIEAVPIQPRETVDGGLARHLGSRPATADLTPDAAKAEYHALKADPDYVRALTDRRHPTHRLATQRRTELFARMYPENPPEGGDGAASDADGDAPPEARFQPGERPEDYAAAVKHAPGTEPDAELQSAASNVFHSLGVTLHDAGVFRDVWNFEAAHPLSVERRNQVYDRTVAKMAPEFGGKEAFMQKVTAANAFLRARAGDHFPIIQQALLGSSLGVSEYTLRRVFAAMERAP